MPKRQHTPFHIIKAGVIYELREEPEGGYTINVPALPGCISFGDTIEEAMTMIADAMEGWLFVARREGLSIPEAFEKTSKPTRRSVRTGGTAPRRRKAS